MTLGVLHVFKLNWLFKYVNFTNYVLSQKTTLFEINACYFVWLVISCSLY